MGESADYEYESDEGIIVSIWRNPREAVGSLPSVETVRNNIILYGDFETSKDATYMLHGEMYSCYQRGELGVRCSLFFEHNGETFYTLAMCAVEHGVSEQSAKEKVAGYLGWGIEQLIKNRR